jgi:hypothetical protein
MKEERENEDGGRKKKRRAGWGDERRAAWRGEGKGEGEVDRGALLGVPRFTLKHLPAGESRFMEGRAALWKACKPQEMLIIHD